MSHTSAYTNDFLDTSPEEDPTGALSTLSELPIICNVNGISSEYGLVMTPGTYPPSSTYQPNLFDQASTESFPICYEGNGETMQDQRSAFQNAYVAAESVSQSLGDHLDEPLPGSCYFPYSPPPSSLLPSVSTNNPNPSDLQEWFASIFGGSDDTSFGSILFRDLHDSIGAENPSASGNCSMETTNCAQNDFYPLSDFPTLAPGMNNVADFENPTAFHAVLGSVPQPECTDVVASGIRTPQDELSLIRPTYGFMSYLPPSSSPLPPVSNPYPSDVQERSTPDDGGRDDTSFSSSPPHDLYHPVGAENPSVRGNSRIEAMSWADSDIYSHTDCILNSDNPNALHALLGSIPTPDDASPLAFGTISSR
ncbi:hypothetical protein ARMSODRAFT_1027037 [Armillaria solidipes]|uniref:Uncharacterized protein n=1 Tax=Armillaria solidipes TaxID=1076256 RepID=A0A2H3AQJ7_9AGAR|nr:hypothetical protein ARMSODRAFT_1027037 [Armillaria solidipes]